MSGIIYISYIGGPPDYEKAFYWAKKFRDFVLEKLSPIQLEEGQKLAQEIYDRMRFKE